MTTLENGNWSDVLEALEKEGVSVDPVVDNRTGMMRTPTVPGGVVVRVFWWGFHVEIPHDALVQLLDAADKVNTLVVLIGGSIPSPAAPWIKLIGPFVAATHERIRALDRGRGVYISMSWFAPGAFVPTSV